jgi:hypothetical protein
MAAESMRVLALSSGTARREKPWIGFDPGCAKGMVEKTG